MQPQSGILPESNQHALFVTAKILAQPASYAGVRKVLSQIDTMTQEIGAIDPAAMLVSVVGIGAEVWPALLGDAMPKALKVFKAREQAGRQAPATAGDLLLHIRSERVDLNFILARRIWQALTPHVALVEEVAGFRYLDSRDLTGFVDGTENPEGDERATVALVGREDPSFEGGSYINMQRYVHSLDLWEQQPVHAQEQVIGRSKPDDVELDENLKPPTAHISRVVIEEQGEELEILRHSMPYGTIDEAGLVFIAYSHDPHPFDVMLDRMIYADAQGHYDHLMDFTTAVTGVSFFAPSLTFLTALSSDAAAH